MKINSVKSWSKWWSNCQKSHLSTIISSFITSSSHLSTHSKVFLLNSCGRILNKIISTNPLIHWKLNQSDVPIALLWSTVCIWRKHIQTHGKASHHKNLTIGSSTRAIKLLLILDQILNYQTRHNVNTNFIRLLTRILPIYWPIRLCATWRMLEYSAITTRIESLFKTLLTRIFTISHVRWVWMMS